MIFRTRFFELTSMTDGFIRKKVESLTLGEKLIKLRTQYRMSLLEISKATRIQVKYLEALESGDHRDLPAEVYVRGFLRSYARYLGLEDDAFVKLYDKEKHIRTHLGKEEPVAERKAIQLGNAWVVTPRTGALIAIGLILLGTFVYLFGELRSFVAEPHLTILSPATGFVTSEGSITVVGKTDRGTQVTLNNEAVFVSNEGDFQEILTLQPGPNTIRILATNRFDKTKETVLFVENTTPIPEPNGGKAEDILELVVRGEKGIVKVVLESDGVVVWNGPWPAGKEERLTVKESLHLTTSDPRVTFFGFSGGIPRPVDPEKKEELMVTYTREELRSLLGSAQ